MAISPKIFRDYDMRGVYPSDINEEVALLVGKAFGTIMKAKGYLNVVVGRDDRNSSPALSKSLITGLIDSGVNVTYIDITLTPTIHFLTCAGGFDAGIMVTASHNPKEFNGFRFDLRNGYPFYGKDLVELSKLMESKDFAVGKGNYSEANLSKDYIKFIQDKFSFNKKIKVVIDCGSGASSLIAPEMFSKMGLDVVPVYCSYDSNFPHGIPDPENPLFLEDLEKEVTKNKADVGFGFDTDGDRFGFVDEKGNSYTTDLSLLLFAEHALPSSKSKRVLYDIKCSKILDEFIPKFGGIGEMLRTGHPYFVKKTLVGDAALGAEYSGHVFFSDRYFGYDDGLYAACRTLEILANSDKSLSELMSKYPKRAGSCELKLPCDDALKFNIVENLKVKISTDDNFKKSILIDGVRAEMSDTGWLLVRPSNTSPYLSVRFEGIDTSEVKFVGEYLLLIMSEYENVDLTPLKNFLGSLK